MKTKIRIAVILALVSILSVVKPASAQFMSKDASKYEGYTMPGYYKTYDDYTKGNITKEKIVVWSGKWFTIVDGKLSDGTKWKEGKIWGYIDQQGFTWYVDAKENQDYRILCTGKIWVFTTSSVSFKTDDKGQIQGISFYYSQGDAFKKIVYIANGPADELTKCNKDNLMAMVADDAEISAKVKDKGIYESRDKKWAESLGDVLGWVTAYNAKHK